MEKYGTNFWISLIKVFVDHRLLFQTLLGPFISMAYNVPFSFHIKQIRHRKCNPVELSGTLGSSYSVSLDATKKKKSASGPANQLH